MIGMNQLDLWSGGHQTNRASKYILERQNSSNSILLCVICNHIEIKTRKNKAFKAKLHRSIYQCYTSISFENTYRANTPYKKDGNSFKSIFKK